MLGQWQVNAPSQTSRATAMGAAASMDTEGSESEEEGDGPYLSEAELQRLENIRRNEAELRTLDIDEDVRQLAAAARPPKRPKRKWRPKTPPPPHTKSKRVEALKPVSYDESTTGAARGLFEALGITAVELEEMTTQNEAQRESILASQRDYRRTHGEDVRAVQRAISAEGRHKSHTQPSGSCSALKALLDGLGVKCTREERQLLSAYTRSTEPYWVQLLAGVAHEHRGVPIPEDHYYNVGTNLAKEWSEVPIAAKETYWGLDYLIERKALCDGLVGMFASGDRKPDGCRVLRLLCDHGRGSSRRSSETCPVRVANSAERSWWTCKASSLRARSHLGASWSAGCSGRRSGSRRNARMIGQASGTTRARGQAAAMPRRRSSSAWPPTTASTRGRSRTSAPGQAAAMPQRGSRT